MRIIGSSWVVVDFPSDRKRGKVLQASSRIDQGHLFSVAVPSKNSSFGPIAQGLVASNRLGDVEPGERLSRGGQGPGYLRGHDHRLEASLDSRRAEVLGGQAPVRKTAFRDAEVSAVAQGSGRAWATSPTATSSACGPRGDGQPTWSGRRASRCAANAFESTSASLASFTAVPSTRSRVGRTRRKSAPPRSVFTL